MGQSADQAECASKMVPVQRECSSLCPDKNLQHERCCTEPLKKTTTHVACVLKHHPCRGISSTQQSTIHIQHSTDAIQAAYAAWMASSRLNCVSDEASWPHPQKVRGHLCRQRVGLLRRSQKFVPVGILAVNASRDFARSRQTSRDQVRRSDLFSTKPHWAWNKIGCDRFHERCVNDSFRMFSTRQDPKCVPVQKEHSILYQRAQFNRRTKLTAAKAETLPKKMFQSSTTPLLNENDEWNVTGLKLIWGTVTCSVMGIKPRQFVHTVNSPNGNIIIAASTAKKWFCIGSSKNSVCMWLLHRLQLNETENGMEWDVILSTLSRCCHLFSRWYFFFLYQKVPLLSGVSACFPGGCWGRKLLVSVAWSYRLGDKAQ